MDDDSDSTMGIGRADHEERRRSRAERLRARARKLERIADAEHRKLETIAAVIPLGQPILVGHHSERRHRRDLKRIDAGMRKAVTATRDAAVLDRRADAADANAAISSDDPDALDRLRGKLADLQTRRAEIKAANRRCRAGDVEALAAVERAYPMMRSCGHDPKRGAPAYVLTNMGAEIRRLTARIKDLQSRASKAPRTLTAGDWTASEDPDTNRVQLRTDGGRRATSNERADLKSHGFRWSPTADAWQRLANDRAWWTATYLIERWAT